MIKFIKILKHRIFEIQKKERIFVKTSTWEFLGILYIIIFGSVLHFTFELSGENNIIAIISSVNESVWEHLKLGFWPAVFFVMIEYPFLKKKNFLLAKAVSIFLIPLSIVLLFYSYTAILGYNMFVMDILTFMAAVVIGQAASFKILEYKDLPKSLNYFALVAVVLLVLTFIVFTFYPPHLPIFKDPVTGGYGID